MSFFKDYVGAMPDLGITYLQVTERLRIQTHPRTLNTLCDLFILEAMLLRQLQLRELQTTQSSEVYASIYNQQLTCMETAISEDRGLKSSSATPSLKMQSLTAIDLRASARPYTFSSWFQPNLVHRQR